MAYIVPTGITTPPTGNQVGITEVGGVRPGYLPAAAYIVANLVPTTGQIWPRGNP